MEENNKQLDKHVGYKIRERRKVLGITQSDLAGILGISHQQIQRYESGENTLSVVRMLEIAQSLNVKPNYFYDDVPAALIKSADPEETIINRHLGRDLRVLLIEDTSSDELLFRKAVEHSGLSIDLSVLQNALDVLDYLLNAPVKYGKPRPDLILLDINMPRLNGLQLLKKIKAEPQIKRIPIVMLTNSIRSADMLESYNNFANGFVQKSSDLHTFFSDINLLLQYWSKTIILPQVA